MQTKVILFDLDGTLLPMDEEVFTRIYFKLLTKKLLSHGYDANELIEGVLAGTEAMENNDGTRTNETAFWSRFAEELGDRVLEDRALFDAFYEVDFQRASSSCGYTAQSARTVELCQELGFRLALATKPIFPRGAMESRLRWAGVDPAAFEYITSYENSSLCKPNPDYYRALLDTLGVAAEDCAMVGNDVREDMIPAASVGLKVFLLTDCLVNRDKEDISRYPRGSYGALQNYLRTLG